MPDSFLINRFDAVPKLWGREVLIVGNYRAGYCGKHLELFCNGMASSVHFHKRKTETFHVDPRGGVALQVWARMPAGKAVPVDADRPEATLLLEPGATITLEPDTPHRFWNPLFLRGGVDLSDDWKVGFYEFSSPDWPEDSIRIVPAGPAPRIPVEGMRRISPLS